MEDNGNFRTSIKGFNKQDVLDYIDSMQSQHMGDLQTKDKQVMHLRQQLTEQQENEEKIKQQLEELQRDTQGLREENIQLKQRYEDNSRLLMDNQRLTQEAEILRLEKNDLNARLVNLQLRMDSVTELEEQVKTLTAQLSQRSAQFEESSVREQETAAAIESLCAEKDDLEEQLNQYKEKIQKTEQELKEYQEGSCRYDGFIGDVGSFIMELHAMGQRFLETAYKRSDSCIKVLETSVSAISARLTEAREQVGQARQELVDQGASAGMRLDELVQALEESANTISNPQANAHSAIAQEKDFEMDGKEE